MSKVTPWVGETQLTMNLMRMLVVLGDDSMLKEELMEKLAEPLAGVLLMEGKYFRGRWVVLSRMLWLGCLKLG